MKSVLTSLLLLLAATVHAQFSLSFNSGIEAPGNLHNYNSYTSIYDPGMRDHVGKLQQKPVFSLRGFWTKKNWQYGFALDRSQTPTLVNGTFFGCILYAWTPGLFEYLAKHSDMEIGYKTTYPVKAFLNRTIALRRFEISGGVIAGYIFSPNFEDKYFEQPFSFNNKGYYGLSAGTQLGASYKCSRHFSINASLAEEYVYIHQGNPSRIGYNVTSATAGVSCNF